MIILKLWLSIGFMIYSILKKIKFTFLKFKLLQTNGFSKNSDVCMILLNGESVKSTLNLVSEECDLFTCNYYLDDPIAYSRFNHKYHFMMDNVFYHNRNYLIDKINGYPLVNFVMNYRYSYNLQFGKHSNLFYLLPGYISLYKLRLIPKKIYTSFFNVSGYMISIALTMGYKKIYIAGLDFEPTHFKHYYDAENNIDLRTISQIKIDEFEGYIQYSLALWQFHQLRNTADRFGIKIINLNKNSRVRAFEYEDK